MAIIAEGNDPRKSARKAVAAGLASGVASALVLVPGAGIPVVLKLVATAVLTFAARFFSDVSKPRPRTAKPDATRSTP